MNINALKQNYNLDEHYLFRDTILNKFANTFLLSNQKSKYKLYHKYIFRSDILEAHIKEHYSYKLKDSKFSFTNPALKDIINDWSYYFIGYTKFSKNTEYCELFLSIKYFSDRDKAFHCTGYSINSHNDKYRYSFDNCIDLGFTNFKYPLIIDGDLSKAIIGLANSLK